MSDLSLLEPDKTESPELSIVGEDAGGPDRRRFPRVKPRHRGLYGISRQLTDRVVDVVLKRPTARIVLIALMALSIIAVWWEIHYRVSSIEARQGLIAERAQLVEHWDDLSHQWSAVSMDEVITQIDQAEISDDAP